MNSWILANAARWVVSSIGLAVYVFIFALVIICLVRVSRYLRTEGLEQKLMRMEIGKIAEEVHLIRQELKNEKEADK